MMRKHTRCGGYALVLVLWMVTILTFVSGFAFASARTEVQLARGHLALVRATTLGESATWIALANAVDERARGSGASSVKQETLVVDTVPVSIETRDIAGKININYAPRELLVQLLASTALSPTEADRLGYLIADWIDSDTDSAISPNEQVPYREAGLSYAPANRPFATLDELRLVAGLPDSVFREIEPYLTTFGTHEYVNRQAADPALIDRLLSAAPADASWEARLLASSPGNVFAMTSTVESDGSRTQRTAVVEFLPSGRGEGFRILAWDE